MTVLWMDNYEGYQQPGATNSTITAEGLSWLNTAYTVLGNHANNARLGIINSGVILGSNRIVLYSGWNTNTPNNLNYARTAFATVYPIGKEMVYNEPIHFGFRLVNFKPGSTPNGVNQFALFDNANGTRNILLTVSFGLDTVRIRYPLEGAIRTRDIPIELFGTHDIIEFRLVKTTNTPDQMSSFTLYVNNRAIVSEDLLCNLGDIENLEAMILGMCIVRAIEPDSNGAMGTWSSNMVSSVTEFGTYYYVHIANYGITDFTINNVQGSWNNTRLGKVRVSGRYGTADADPNRFFKSAGAGSIPTHAEVVHQIPPKTGIYLETEEDAAEEIFTVLPFNVGSEAILASGMRMVSSRDDPAGYNLKPVYRIGTFVYPMDTVATPPVPGVKLAIHEINPATGTRWTPTTINSVDIGVQSTIE